MKKNKKAVIGATMTWVVATIIILFVVFLFIYTSYAIAKQKEVLGFEPGVQESGDFSENEQILISLLETELYGKTVKQYIVDGDYDNLEESLEIILSELPESRKESYVLYVYENDKLIKTIGGSKEYKEDEQSIIYLTSGKKVRLY